MSQRICPSCGVVCDGYNCVEQRCCIVPCASCRGDDKRPSVIPSCYNDVVVSDWTDIDMEVDVPE